MICPAPRRPRRSCCAPERTRDELKVWITDSGVGLKPAELAEANKRLLNPPDIDSMAIDRVGFH